MLRIRTDLRGGIRRHGVANKQRLGLRRPDTWEGFSV